MARHRAAAGSGRRRLRGDKGVEPMTPEEAKQILEDLRAGGVPDDEIASRLGVSVTYMRRLGKRSYWVGPSGRKNGTSPPVVIPNKAARGLRRLRESPTYPDMVIREMHQLQTGDEYWIHTAAPILEMEGHDVIRAVLDAVGRGATFRYLFPTRQLIERYCSFLLLRQEMRTETDYLTLFARMWRMANDDVRDRLLAGTGIRAHRLHTLMMLAPWQKIILIRQSRGEGPRQVVTRLEINMLGQTAQRPGGAGWKCVNYDPSVIEEFLEISASGLSTDLDWNEIRSYADEVGTPERGAGH